MATPIVSASAFKNHHIQGILEPRSPNGNFKPLLDPGGGFASENAVRRFQK
jgi:hypothetical protein